MKIDIETLRKTKGIGSKTLERIIEQHEIDNNINSYKSNYKPSDKYKVDKNINLWQGDCLELMEHIPDKSIDMILCDLPYGTTVCSWDEIIPFKPLWKNYERIIKNNGVIVLFGSEPFSTKLRASNLKWYKYDWYWKKTKPSGFLNAKKQPMRSVETISVFSKKPSVYKPQGLIYGEFNNDRPSKSKKIQGKTVYGLEVNIGVSNAKNYPHTLLEFANPNQNLKHPTQKPIDLLEYLIKTYTNKDMLVLDNTMGSGSTGVACKNTNRKFIGIELDEEYFNIAKDRINNVK